MQSNQNTFSEEEIREFRNMISKGEIREVFNLLEEKDYRDSDLNNELILISSNFSRYERDSVTNVLSSEESSITYNKIVYKLLTLIEKLGGSNGITNEDQYYESHESEEFDEVDIRINECKEKDSFVLDLSELFLDEIPREINDLVHLRILNLSGNKIEKIEHLDKLVNLKELHLDENILHKIEGLEKLSELVLLDLAVNNISKIEDLRSQEKLNTLFLGYNLISKIENIEGLKNLEKLELIDNYAITKIEGLESLTNLKNLSLSNNKISQIEGIDNLKLLKSLVLGGNEIEKIEGLDNNSNLRYLGLEGNKIKKIENINNLTKLQKLHLNSNQIEKVENVAGLPQLKEILLRDNKINTIEDLQGLRRLNELRLDHNQINKDTIINNKDFFNYLASRKESLKLTINDNPFLKEILGFSVEDYSNPELPNHLPLLLGDYEHIIKNKKEFEKVKLPHKLVFIGNSNAGKSSLLRWLTTGDLVKKDDIPSTEVLDIKEWNPQEKEIPQFMIYDFGGQDYYHATYQMFCSKDAHYVLVWSKDNNTKELNTKTGELRPESYYCFDVNYWIGNIQYLIETLDENTTINDSSDEQKAVDSWMRNLLLVENKIDDTPTKPYPLELDQDFNQAEQFKICLLQNATKDDGLKNIFLKRRALLKSYIENLKPIIKEDISFRGKAIQSFFKHLSTLQKEQKGNFWTFQDLEKRLKEIDEWKNLDQLEIKRLVGRFKSSGIILWYSAEQGHQDQIWLNPIELQKKVLQILKSTADKYKGKVPYKELNKISDFESYKSILIQEQIIFDDKKENQYIVPQRLEVNPSNYAIYQLATEGLQKAFSVRFKYFMPLGIMNRLICILGEVASYKYYSRYELVFSFDSSSSFGKEKIWLKCDPTLLEIEIWMTRVVPDTVKNIFQYILIAYHREPYSDHTVTLRFEPMPEDDSVDSIARNVSLTNEDIDVNYSVLDPLETAIINIRSRTTLYPKDLQIALGNDFFVKYADLESAQKAKLGLITTKDTKGSTKQIKTHLYNPFMEEKFTVPKSVFVSYSHDDIAYRRELQKYLINLERDQKIEIWQDGMIQVGMEWDKAIRENLEKADIVIMLVSQSFIASNYVNEVELRKALEKVANGQNIFPILVKNCDFKHWKGVPSDVSDDLKEEKISIGKFQFLPFDEDQRLKALNKWNNPEDAWVQISDALRVLVK